MDRQLSNLILDSFNFWWFVNTQMTTVALATVHAYCHTLAFGEPKGRTG